MAAGNYTKTLLFSGIRKFYRQDTELASDAGSVYDMPCQEDA